MKKFMYNMFNGSGFYTFKQLYQEQNSYLEAHNGSWCHLESLSK